MERRLRFQQRIRALGRRHRRAQIPKIAFFAALIVVELAIVSVARNSFGSEMGWLSSTLFISSVLLFAVYHAMAETVHHARLRGVDLTSSLQWFAGLMTIVVYGTVYIRNDTLLSGSAFLISLLGFRMMKGGWDLFAAIQNSRQVAPPPLWVSLASIGSSASVWFAVWKGKLPPESMIACGVIMVAWLNRPFGVAEGVREISQQVFKKVVRWPPAEDLAKIAHSLSGYAPILLLISLLDSAAGAARWSMLVTVVGCYLILRMYRSLGSVLEDKADECVSRQDWLGLSQALRYLVSISVGAIVPLGLLLGVGAFWGYIPSPSIAFFLVIFGAHQLVQTIGHSFRIDHLMRSLSLYLRWGLVPVAVLVLAKPEEIFWMMGAGEGVLLILNLATLLGSNPRAVLENQFYSQMWNREMPEEKGRGCVSLRDFFAVYRVMQPVLSRQGGGSWFGVMEGDSALETAEKCLPYIRSSDLLVKVHERKCLLWLPTCLREADVLGVSQKLEKILGHGKILIIPQQGLFTLPEESSNIEGKSHMPISDRQMLLSALGSVKEFIDTQALVWVCMPQGYWINHLGKRAGSLEELRLRRHSKNALTHRSLGEVASTFDHALEKQVLVYAPFGQAWGLVTVDPQHRGPIEAILREWHDCARAGLAKEKADGQVPSLPPVVFQRLLPVVVSLANRLGCKTDLIEREKSIVSSGGDWVMVSDLGAGKSQNASMVRANGAEFAKGRVASVAQKLLKEFFVKLFMDICLV